MSFELTMPQQTVIKATTGKIYEDFARKTWSPIDAYLFYLVAFTFNCHIQAPYFGRYKNFELESLTRKRLPKLKLRTPDLILIFLI